MLELGAGGDPDGYDILHASTKGDLIGRIVLGKIVPAAAE
jgi:hypothetical protein